MIRKPGYCQRLGCFRTRPLPKTEKITQRTEENGCLFLRKIGSFEDRLTVTANWYVHHCLPMVFEVWCQHRPKTGLHGLFLHHDNASAHTAATTVDFLNESEVQQQPHRPYSPDLSPCDFFLIPEVKKQLKGTLFESAEGALRAFTRAVEDIPKLTWAEKWNKRFHRMTKCIAAEGRFFENNGVICCLVSPISNEYPETFGASLRSSRVIKMTIVATPTGRRTVTYLLLISVRTASK